MAFGLCFGGGGIGSCGGTESSQSMNITNTAIASAYYKSAFNCESAVTGGNVVKASGICSCGELGIGNSIDCAAYQLKMANLQAETCDNVLTKAPQMPAEMVTCICHSGGAGCNISIDQKSIVTSQAQCKNAADVRTNLDNNFVSDLMANLKANFTDIGALLDSSTQKSMIDMATTIKNNISTEMIQNISQKVVANNVVEAGCGGLNFGITQYSQFNNILEGLSQSSAIQEIKNKMVQKVAASISTEGGFLHGIGKIFGSLGGFIGFIIGLIIIVVICGLIYKWWSARNANKSS